MTRRSPLSPFSLGLAALYVGERSLTGDARWVLDIIGGVFLLAAFVFALLRLSRAMQSAHDETKRAAVAALSAYILSLLGVGLYAIAVNAPADSTTLRPILSVAWPFVLVLGLAPAVAIELALGAMARSPRLELWRIKLASRSARVIALAVVAFAGVNYAASQWNRKIDLSYFRTTAPSEPTKALVANLDEPVRFVLFFPPGNEVLEHVRGYLEELTAVSPKLSIEVVDQAVEPNLARDAKVRGNGALLVERGARRETLQVGVEMENARDVLRKLDREVQQRLIKVARPPRVVYFTSGHMEREFQPSASDKRNGYKDFKGLFESIGYTVKRLGLGEGLGSEVPKDAGLVVIAGPMEPFLPAERAAIQAFLDRGGRLLALIDPETGVTEDELLTPLGVKVDATMVAADRSLVPIREHMVSPFVFATTRSMSHPSTTTLTQYSGRLAVIVLGAGSIEKLAEAPSKYKVTTTLQSLPEAWADQNKNGQFDTDEKRGARDLAVAIEGVQPKEKEGEKKPEGANNVMRALVIADADVAGNGLAGVSGNPGNTYLLLDAIKWLGGDEAITGKIESEEDVALVFKKEDDAVWFYGVSFLMPALVLGVGLVISRRSRQRRS